MVLSGRPLFLRRLFLTDHKGKRRGSAGEAQGRRSGDTAATAAERAPEDEEKAAAADLFLR